MGHFDGTRWAIAALVTIACTVSTDGGSGDETDPTQGGRGGDAGQASAGDPGASAGADPSEPGGAGSGGTTQTDAGTAGESPATGGAAGESPATGGAAGEGAAAGGASGDSSAGDGSAGAPAPLPLPELPTGCVIQSENALTSIDDRPGCTIGVACTALPGVPDVKVTCWAQADGRWNCEDDQLSFTGLQGSSLCRLAASVVAKGVDATFTGEETCVSEIQSAAGGLCETRDLCQRAATFDSGIEATLTQRKGVRCSGSPALCQCQNEERYRIQGLGYPAVCQRGYDLCEEPVPPPDGPTVCGTPSSDTTIGVNECWTFSSCTTTTEIEPGISHIHSFDRDILCQAFGPQDQGGSDCYCYTDIGDYSFESPALVEDDSSRTCERFHSLCVDPEGFDFQGPGECTWGELSVSEPQTCALSRSCRRPAVFDGESMMVKVSGTLQCRPEGDSFRCECHNQSEDVFTVQAASLGDACTAAAAECPEPDFIRPPG